MSRAMLSGDFLARISCLLVERETLLCDFLEAHRKLSGRPWSALSQGKVHEFGGSLLAGIPEFNLKNLSKLVGADAVREVSAQLDRFIMMLVEDLNALVETIVLCESICWFHGFVDAEKQSHGLISSGFHPGWTRIQYYPEEATRLQRKIQNALECSRRNSTSAIGLECMAIAVLTHDHSRMLYQIHFDEYGNLKPDLFEVAACDSEYSYGLADGYIQYLTNFLHERRGQEWQAYFDCTKRRLSTIPHEAFLFIERRGQHKTRDYLSLSQLMYSLSLFDEIETSIAEEAFAIPSWSSRQYFDNIGLIQNARSIDLRNSVINTCNDVVQKSLEQHGLITVDLKVPQVLRYCLRGAQTVDDVIDAALHLRTEPWVADYRKYLLELCEEADPRIIDKQFKKIDRFVSASCQGMLQDFGDITIDIEGNFSITRSIFKSIRQMKMRLHPFVVFNSKLHRASDSIADLSRVLQLPRKTVRDGLEQAII